VLCPVKLRGSVLAFVLLAGGFWHARAEGVHHSLGMDVQLTGSGGDGTARSGLNVKQGGKPLGGGWVTATQKDYSQHRERDSSIELDVHVRNLSRLPDTATLEWYFFKKAISGGDEVLYDSGTEVLKLEPTSSSTYAIKAKVLHNSVTKRLHTTSGVNSAGVPIPPSATVSKKGSRVSGWIVRLMTEGTPLYVKASSPTLLETAEQAKVTSPQPDAPKKKKK
jgi:hypothetical protein